MPKRLSKNARYQNYQWLCHRDGERCQHCGAVPTNPISAVRVELNSAVGGVSYIPSEAPRQRSKKGEVVLDIDHINEDKNDWRPENLQLLCRRCNVTKQNRARGKHPSDLSVCVRERMRTEGCSATRVVKAVVDYNSGSAEMQAAGQYEIPFRRWVMAVLGGTDFVEKEDLIYSGAETVGCSPSTAERYLKKLMSSAGPLKEARDSQGTALIMMKPEFVE